MVALPNACNNCNECDGVDELLRLRGVECGGRSMADGLLSRLSAWVKLKEKRREGLPLPLPPLPLPLPPLPRRANAAARLLLDDS
jgi:hypothetical protein